MSKLHFSRVVLTRPRLQNQKLQKRLSKVFHEEGITAGVELLPLLEIVPQLNAELAKSFADSLSTAQWVSFVSPNAFLMADQLLRTFGFTWPCGLKIAVVGGGSEQSIIDSGLKYQRIVKPKDQSAWDSEGLWLALQASQEDWQGTQVVMVHGEGGRTFLTEHLQKAGAHVQEFAVYQRESLSIHDVAWQSLLHTPSLPSIWMFSSSQAAQSLKKTLVELSLLGQVTENSIALVSHPRIEEVVKQLGFCQVLMITPGDDELLKMMVNLFKTGL
jgi:uroporphyrinogen-III synthase